MALVTAVGIAVLRSRRRPLLPPGAPSRLATFALFALYAVLLLALIPGYNAAGMSDWALYYPNTLVYLRALDPAQLATGLRFEYLAKRTPFFSLIDAFLMAPLGARFVHYQLASVLASTTLFLGAAVLAKRLPGDKEGRFALGLFSVCPLLMAAILIPSPKPLATFFLILAYEHAERLNAGRDAKREAAFIAAFSAAAFMTHPSMLLYLAVPVCGLAARTLVRGDRRTTLSLGAAILILAAPWYAWLVGTFGARALAPVATLVEKPTVGSYLWSRAAMALTTAVAPSTVLASGADGPLRFQWETFLGGFSVFGWLFFIPALRRAPLKPRPPLLWAACGAALCLAVHLTIDLKGHAANIMLPLAAILFIELAGRAALFPRPARLSLAALMALEFALGRGLAYASTLSAPHGALPWFHALGRPSPFSVVLAPTAAWAGFLWILSAKT